MTTFNQTVPSHILYTLLVLSLGLPITASAATNTDIAEPEQQNVLKPKTSTQENVLDYIPKWVDASPTVLPEQSNQPIVPRQKQKIKHGLTVNNVIFDSGLIKPPSKLMIGLVM